MHRLIVLSGALILALVAPGADVAIPQPQLADSARYEFAERFRREPTAACSGLAASPVCGEVIFFNERLATPTGVASVDVVVSFTGQYLTSVGDGARFLAEMAPQRQGPYRALAPGAFRVGASSRMPDSATATWKIDGVEAGGREHNVALIMGSRGIPSWVELQKMTVIVEMMPTDPSP